MVAGVGLFTLAVWGVVAWQLHGQEQELLDRQALIGAEAVAGRLSEVNRLHKELMSKFTSDPELLEAFKQQDDRALQSRAVQLRKLIPDALQVRLLPLIGQEPRTNLPPDLGYALLAQLRQAEQRTGVTPAQVHQYGTPQQHISMVTAVREQGDGEAVGLIQVAFAMDSLQQALGSAPDYVGRLELQQQASESVVLSLAVKGPEELAQETPSGQVKVAGSIWQVAYWPAGKGWMTLGDGQFFIAVLVLIVLHAGLLWFLTERLRKALKRDQRSIVSLVEGLLMGRPPKQYQAQVADMQPTLDVLLHQIKEHRMRVAEQQKSASLFSAGPQPSAPATVQEAPAGSPPMAAISHESIELSASIFRAYDIRGLVGETLTPQVVNLLGQSIGSEIFEKGLQRVVVARDGRESSESLHNALIAGLQSSGRDVIDVGLVPTPLLYFAARELQGDCGVMVTGSHNARQYNGLKIVVQNESLTPEGIQELRRRIDAGQLLQGSGSFDSQEIVPEYIERIVSDIRLARPMKVVIDCGNGVASVVAPELYRQMGCEVIELFCEVDGRFPNHHPDPCQPQNMQALQRAVVEHQADIGFAFDGDGDRIGVVDSEGKLIWPDRLLMYLAIDILTREPGGDIIYDVKCTRHLANVVLSNGGRPLMWKSGHSMLKAKMQETHALLAGEFSGHIIFSERWYGFDDGLYAGARLLEILALDYRSSAEAFAELPESVTTPEYSLPLQEGESSKIMQALNQLPDLPGARSIKIDGLRLEFEQGWGLVRASNTAPALLFRFEADDETGLQQVQGVFRDLMAKVAPGLKPPF
ncbi:MAG: phosphomannomutase/phosphoglucomutase [Chromatiales bacterium]|jgi:phosphomannomutase/phosphoglucomutase